MLQFLKYVLATIVGMLLFMLIIFFFFAAAVGSAFEKETTVVESNSILHIQLKQPIAERSDENPFKNFDVGSFKTNTQPGLSDIVKEISNAKDDDKIKGIFLDMDNVQGGYASVEEIRNALVDFKKSKKFILAYAEYYSTKAYYLASVADKVYLNPQGAVDFKGLHTELMFFKGAFEKLEIEPEVIRQGKFKSAVEPFILDKMSDENRAQIASFVDDVWNHSVKNISLSRKMDATELETIADNLAAENADDALRLKLVDALAYYDQVQNDLNTKCGTAIGQKPKFVSLTKYSKAPLAKTKKFSKEKIAVIYANGEIVSGKGQDDEVGSETIAAALRNARNDDNVKAIVLRVNSPGGSALASDVIWRETVLAKAQKPFIVSMGNLAASGGYYISAAADTIVAQPNTITGSIGVFGVLLNAQKMFNNKLGLTFDTYKTGPYADLGTITRPITENERNIIQKSVEQVYDTFTKRVAAGRNMSQADVDSIGQGRVWSAQDAQEIGLVDVFGGLNDAIAIAAKKANVENYRIKELPEQKEPLQELMEDLSGEAEAKFLSAHFGDSYKYLKTLDKLVKLKGVQARLPFEIVTE